MRVAHILRKYNPAEWGGTETAVKQLLDGLRAHGVNGTVYAPELPSPPPSDPLAAAGHEVRRYKTFIPAARLSKEQRDQLISVGGNLMSLDLGPKLFAEAGGAEKHPDRFALIHTHTGNRLGAIAAMAARLRRIPCVMTIHGGVLDLPQSVRENLARPLEGGWEWGKIFGLMLGSRRLLERVDAIITCNQREAALLQQKYPRQRVMAQPHGVTIGRYDRDCRECARAAFPLAGKRVLLVLGRIDPVKNQGWVLQEAPRIAARWPDTLIVLAGPVTDELYGKALKKEAKRLGLENSILFTGGLPPGDERLIGLLQEAAVVIVPSQSETFGLVILESWAARRPVLSSPTSGARDLITDGENGLFFDLQKPAEFHQGLERLLNDKALALRLGSNGRAKTAAEYDTTTLAGRVKALYEELIHQKRA